MVAALAPPDAARASCNTPPPTNPAIQVASAADSMAPATAPTSYTSTFGNIDAPFLVPGSSRLVQNGAITKNDTVYLAYLPAPGTGGASFLVKLAKTGNCQVPVCAGVTGRCEKVSTLSIPSNGQSVVFEVPRASLDGTRNGTPLVGPVRIAVTDGTDPCDLARPATPAPCDPIQHPTMKLHACVDSLAVSGPPTPEVTTVTALPPWNDFSRLCDAGDDCVGGGQSKQMLGALDANGDLYFPIDWTKVLHGAGCPSGKPCKRRTVGAATSLTRTESVLTPIPIPDQTLSSGYKEALRSFNEKGESYSTDIGFSVETKGAPDELTLKGSIDEAKSVLRIRHCPNDALTCTAGTEYFDVSSRMTDGNGPLALGNNGKKKGYCEKTQAECDSNDDCGSGPGKHACRKFHATAGSVEIDSVPPPPPPPPGGEHGRAGHAAWAIVGAVVTGIVVCLVAFL